jgi:hypothetical protein
MGAQSRRVLLTAVTGNLDGNAAGTREGMGSVSMHRVLDGSLSALLEVDCETNTMTMFAEWQVSLDGSAWVLCSNGTQNAAAVVLATGTGGADPLVTRVLEAPASVYAYPYARLALRNEVAAGNTVDTYSCRYAYLRA